MAFVATGCGFATAGNADTAGNSGAATGFTSGNFVPNSSFGTGNAVSTPGAGTPIAIGLIAGEGAPTTGTDVNGGGSFLFSFATSTFGSGSGDVGSILTSGTVNNAGGVVIGVVNAGGVPTGEVGEAVPGAGNAIALGMAGAVPPADVIEGNVISIGFSAGVGPPLIEMDGSAISPDLSAGLGAGTGGEVGSDPPVGITAGNAILVPEEIVGTGIGAGDVAKPGDDLVAGSSVKGGSEMAGILVTGGTVATVIGTTGTVGTGTTGGTVAMLSTLGDGFNGGSGAVASGSRWATGAGDFGGQM